MEKRHLERSEEVTGSTRDETPSSSGQTSSKTCGFDDVIMKVANAISEDVDLRRLGLELGVQTPDINRALQTNWAGGKHGEMPDHVQRLRTKLRARYIEEFSEVKVSPMDPESRTWLQHIFVSLILMLGCIGDQEQPIEYENLFSFIQTKTKKGFITRVAFLGEAGVGKSTLFAKIALDWAMGKCLQDITVLFHESFRDIEDSPFFGNIVMNHFPDDTEIIGEWIDKYIKENQRKVLILLDGMDEAKMDIKNPNRKLAIVSIVRRESFIDTSVLISTRPFGADQIKSIQKIHEKYCYIQVKGFTKENRNKYIKQYFNNDRASASSLIHFMNTNSVVSEYMAPFPIFCCMLCYMWKVGSKRETTENLQAVSQLMKEMDFALREQYSSRYTDNEEGYQCHMEKAAEAIVKVGCVAFEGLLKNQFIFTKDEMKACDGFAAIACHVGILSGEKRLASRKIRQRDRKQFIQEFSFPHKLLQEHSASLYIASLYNHSRSEFNRILTHKLIKDYRAFKYVLYFTAAHGGEVGKSVLEALCKKVDDMEFIIRAAFECHDSEAIDPFRNLLKTKAHLVLFRHIPFTTLAFTLETMGKEVVRRSSSIRESLGVSRSLEANASSSHEAAVGLFTLQDLRHLDIMLRCLDDEFYTGMSAAASQSKIEELTHEYANLGSVASSHYARGLCLMPNLRSLKLRNAELSDEFYSTMACEASNSKIEELNQFNADLGSAASSHYARGLCSMPNLRSLMLTKMMLSDKFYLTMASESSKSKIEKLTLGYMDLGSAPTGLCFMPTLRSLGLTSVKLSDEFYSTMASEIEKLTHGYADLGSVASSHYARGLCFMPNLRSLKLYDTRQTSSVDELSVGNKHVTSLWSLGLHTSCPRIKTLKLDCSRRENVSSVIVEMACSPFHHLTHLHIEGDLPYPSFPAVEVTTLDDPLSFCKAVNTSCPLLTKLSITRIGLGNEKTAEIILLMKAHPNLTSIE
ncbi:NACHT, LRR and PYD domains-containing protein 3-like [Strongylocentrotus purpuratus]|uniref:NACHT domain-containing protein n=1 Tax=Strongylocentrotus purpuratus TaxID=7668 RepID=A0A7M7P6T7_STRPU|nr:NACHT, LRR and PYD domains-containing protein 3-like [Strongylocentrotus purpuratus]